MESFILMVALMKEILRMVSLMATANTFGLMVTATKVSIVKENDMDWENILGISMQYN